MDYNIINSLLDHETVTSTYADIYIDNDYCKNEPSFRLDNDTVQIEQESKQHETTTIEWISPSDLLIGKIELIPPFTSKITRGKTHEGILAIGNGILEKEHTRFLASLTGMLKENDKSWNHILVNEKKLVTKKVAEIFQKIFQQKSKIMNEEITIFFENTLQDLEKHLQAEVQNVLKSLHAKIISTLNIEIPRKLKRERYILENVLKKKYKTEVDKIVSYYKYLLDNELVKHNNLINNALNERNKAIRNFCWQIDAERLTTSMYIMSIERKKCKIKQMFLEYLQNSQLTENLTKIKERKDIIRGYKQREQRIFDLNKQWEEKIKKVLELFLKFISFSLKLLPEQSNFLFDFQRMVILQFNEMQKQPNIQSSILVDEDGLKNIFEFGSPTSDKKACDVEPFVIIGDLSDPIPPRYGSTETLPADVDLPYLRVNRQYIYAKCHGYEEIKEFLNSQKCQCSQQKPPIKDVETNSKEMLTPMVQPLSPHTSADRTSSIETFLIDDIVRLNECPARKCTNWKEKNMFPLLPSYLDFNEKNFERVKAILGQPCMKTKAPDLYQAKDIAYTEVPFSETKEKYRHVETQYSVQELETYNIDCTCVNNYKVEKLELVSTNSIEETHSQTLMDALTKRKTSLRRMLNGNPNLLKIFVSENYGFQL